MIKKSCEFPKDKTVIYTGIILFILLCTIGCLCWYKHYVDHTGTWGSRTP